MEFVHKKIMVGGPVCCVDHPEAKILFDYPTMRYEHRWPNGGLCRAPIAVKKLERRSRKMIFVDIQSVNPSLISTPRQPTLMLDPA